MKLCRVLPVIMLALASCSDDNEPPGKDGHEYIEFGVTQSTIGSRSTTVDFAPDTLRLRSDVDTCQVDVYVSVTDMRDDGTLSRAAPVTGADAISNFSVYAFYYPSPDAVAQPFFAGEKAVRDGDVWSTSTLYYWPDTPGSTLDFWAIAGSGAADIVASQSGKESMAIDYTVPQSVAAQSDILVATTPRLNTPGESVPLTFNHICAAVRFVFGSEMQPGSIREIKLSGIMSHGRYTTQWNDLSGATMFTVPVGLKTSGSETFGAPIVSDDCTLMMLPQRLPDDAMLTVLFHDDVTGTDRTLTASLAGSTWRQGMVTTYRIGISPGFKLEFLDQVPVQDAHYVICNTVARVTGMPADKAWSVTVSTSDGADASVQLTSEVNEFARQGFWTDKEMANGQTITSRSARGTSTFAGRGSGDFPITVFLPENATDDDRTVTLTLSLDQSVPGVQTSVTQEFRQVHPLWSDGAGWEQIDDNLNGAYGFQYTTKHVYVYNNSSGLITINRVRNMIENLVSQYSASSYVTYSRYSVGVGSYRYYVAIDYSKLSNLGGIAASSTDGLTNTRQLFNFGGSAISNTFELALTQMVRLNTSNTPAFRRRADNDPSDVPQEVEGTLADESQALTLVLKKNRYYLNKFTDSETGIETTAPKILEEDIKWYLPAYGQFGSMPAGSFVPGDFWSSTAYSDAVQAYSGDGVLSQRTVQKKIRVVRVPL